MFDVRHQISVQYYPSYSSGYQWHTTVKATAAMDRSCVSSFSKAQRSASSQLILCDPVSIQLSNMPLKDDSMKPSHISIKPKYW